MTEPCQLSDSLQINNIDDFLAPNNSCVFPLADGTMTTQMINEPAGSLLAPIILSCSPYNPTRQCFNTIIKNGPICCNGGGVWFSDVLWLRHVCRNGINIDGQSVKVLRWCRDREKRPLLLDIMSHWNAPQVESSSFFWRSCTSKPCTKGFASPNFMCDVHN